MHLLTHVSLHTPLVEEAISSNSGAKQAALAGPCLLSFFFALIRGSFQIKEEIHFAKCASPCLLPVQVLFLSNQRYPRLVIFASCRSQRSFPHIGGCNWGAEESPCHPFSAQNGSIGDLNYVFLACLHFAVAFFFEGERQVFYISYCFHSTEWFITGATLLMSRAELLPTFKLQERMKII